MGRIFEKRKYKMFARWAKASKAFTKLGKEIAIAVKRSGPDPDSNPRLRMAIQTAKSLNMPKDRIENAIHKASSKDEADLDEINYEGYGPNGVAIFVECATNNPTRTVANVRNIFSKHGGNLGVEGALKFVFERVGVFKISKPNIDLETLELELIDVGLEELYETESETGETEVMIHTGFESFAGMQKFLEQKGQEYGLELKSAILDRIPLTTTSLSKEQEEQINKIVGLLEDDDDVQNVYHNMESTGD